MGRFRPAISVVLCVLVALCVTTATFSLWANSTLFDSASFSERAVSVLDSAAVRKELAAELTEQLARAGNQQAINFRPAFQFAVEVAADTDTFRSIFRGAIRRTHEALLAGRGSGAGIDLSDSVAIIGSTIQLPGTAQAGDSEGGGALNNSFDNVTKTIGDLGIWGYEDLTAAVFLASAVLAVALSALAILIAFDRREAVVRLGLSLVLAGALILLIRFAAEFVATRMISDPGLAEAAGAAISSATSDLRALGLWIPAYGLVIAAAAAHSVYTPARVWERVKAWGQRRRATTGGTVLLAVLLLLAGLLITTSPGFWVTLAAQLAGLWLAYYGIVQLLGLIRRVPADTPVDARAGSERRRLVLAGAAVAVLIGMVTGGLLVVTRQAATSARAAGQQRCNGDDDLCDRPLNEVVFVGSHNSMSSALYPGWLFAEQISTIKGQLEAGVRALLIDTHYGVPSSVRVPGADSRLVLTDRAAELSAPPGEDIDPSVAARAQALAARASRAANAQRGIFLCHNFCELGAISFAEVLADVKGFLDTNPDEVVTLIIQDATTPADTAAAIDAAGLAETAYTLRKGEPLPTLRDMIESERRLLVFAEQGGAGAPAWYMKAYDWFQETGYRFASTDAFNCRANRGNPENPLFLLNHWVSNSPPNPSAAQRANGQNVLEQRAFRCLSERGRVPNVIALDFAERGGAVGLIGELGDRLRDAYLGTDVVVAPTTVPGPPTTVRPGVTTTSTPPDTVPPLPEFTQVTTLTGGNPEAFCAAVPAANRVFGAWVVAVLSAPANEQGRADLAYAPLLQRELSTLYDVAPEELVALSAELRERVGLAIDELRGLGLDDNEIGALASRVEQRLTEDVAADAVTIELEVLEQLARDHGAAEVEAAAGRITDAVQDRLDALDLGEVSPDAATASGYTCLGTA